MHIMHLTERNVVETRGLRRETGSSSYMVAEDRGLPWELSPKQRPEDIPREERARISTEAVQVGETTSAKALGYRHSLAC